MAQWVKNLTTATQVTAELRVQSLAWHSGLKDLVLQQLWLRFISLWPGNFHMPWVQPLKKKKKKKKKKLVEYIENLEDLHKILYFWLLKNLEFSLNLELHFYMATLN